MSRDIALSEDVFTCFAVDAVRTDGSVCCCSCAVFEVQNHVAAFFLLDGLEALVEMCTFCGYSFDEFVEEVSAVYALHTAWSLLCADDFVFVLAFALVRRHYMSMSLVFYVASQSAENATYDNVFCKVVGVRFPHVRCCMLLESVPSMGSYEFESALGIRSNGDASTYFAKGVCSFVDLDIDVFMLEETKC